MQKLNFPKYRIFILSAIIWLAIDLITKYYLLSANIGQVDFIKDYFYLTMHTNQGVAFGLYFGHVIQIIISIIIVILLTLAGFKYLSTKNKFYSYALLGIIIGGAIGNVVNRIHLGYVIDFIYIWPIPVFNIADVGITLGLIVLFLINLKIKN